MDRRPLKPIAHGTVSGYRAEWYRGYRTCRACRNAWNAYCKPHNRRQRGKPRLANSTPPPSPEQVREEILRDSQDPTI